MIGKPRASGESRQGNHGKMWQEPAIYCCPSLPLSSQFCHVTMATMATELPIGTRIRRARERKRWTQQQLADAVDVNVKTVNNWETGRTEPVNSIGAIEEALSVNLSNGSGVERYEDPDEARIWAMAQFSPSERRALIAALRSERGTDG